MNRERLHKSRPAAEDIDCLVVPPGVSLTMVLQQFHLTTQMKVTLAYVLAKAAWRYYNSHWMNSLWTSDTIHFIAEHDLTEQRTDLYVTKPYLSVCFDEASEMESSSGVVHHDPWILALGIMLVQIGRGKAACSKEEAYLNLSPVAKVNSDRLHAKTFCTSDQPWPGFDVTRTNKCITSLEKAYREAASACLNPQLFERDVGETDSDRTRWLSKNRETLYCSVVAPLEALMRSTRFLDDMKVKEAVRLIRTQKVQSVLSNQVQALPSVGEDLFSKEAAALLGRPKEELDYLRSAEIWLQKVESLQTRLQLHLSAQSPKERIRVVVIDTGCDVEPEFFEGRRRWKLPKGFWKDLVADCPKPVDEDKHGHGTAMVSLVMRVAPQAHIYVARVARNAADLEGRAGLVAKVSTADVQRQ